jgi:hypothetical protein
MSLFMQKCADRKYLSLEEIKDKDKVKVKVEVKCPKKALAFIL